MDTFTRTRSAQVISLFTAAAAVLTVGGCSSAAPNRPESASAPEPQHRILFQGQGRTHLLVGMADLDGSDITYPFAELPGGDQTNPDWSPDGSQAVLAVNDGTRDDLWVMDSDGSNGRLLLDCEGACRWLDDPAWSPDGSTIVYSRMTARGKAGWGSLEEVDVESGEVSVIVPARARSFTAGARWSPDGSEIVFESVRKVGPGLSAEVDGVSLRIVERDSAEVGAMLTDPELFAATADWSPDGTTVVYSALESPDADAPDLFVIPAAGGKPRQVTALADGGGHALEPTWHTDSSRIVFSGKLPGSFVDGVLLTVTMDSAAVEKLGGSTIIGTHPRIEPGE